ncbi:MAG: YfjI family protein [Gammaproteobacteria bacterium]|nr:YfjI family protein [Gammaproteobacteria bacterium]
MRLDHTFDGIDRGATFLDEQAAKRGAKREWPEPQPFPDNLAPVPRFEAALLPESVHPWIADIAERVSCPPDFVAIPTMLALATALGRKVGVRPQTRTDWTVIANLWGLIVGRPGMMKSPAMAQATAPLKRLAARAQEEYAARHTDWERAKKVADLQAEAGEKAARKALGANPKASVGHLLAGDAQDVEPCLRRYTTSNATPEALGELLRQNPQGLMLERDEIMGLLRELDREDKADHRAFLLEAWDGSGSYTFDRIGRGFNLHIPAMALSVCGTTQPARLQAYLQDALKGGASDDGLAQRFSLMVWPDASGDWRNVDRFPDGDAKRQAFAAFDRMDMMTPESVGAMQDTDFDGEPEGVPYLRLSEGALELFLEWRTSLEARLRSGDLIPALESHLAKYRKLVPALALICHLADGGTGPVAEMPTLKALAWAQYLEGHAIRCYGSATHPELAAAKAILSRIKRGDLPRDGFGSRDVWRPGWSGLDRERAAAGLAYCVDMDWLAETQRPTEGRAATVYTLNPRARL